MEKAIIVEEVNEAINNLKAGRYEEVYNVLTNLSDELTTEVIISKDNRIKKELGEAINLGS